MPLSIMGKLIFISGTDTGIGKTYVTGLIAKYLLQRKKKVITMKPVQTGCSGISEDILTHRKIMGTNLDSFDLDGTTNPYNLFFPSSPHLSAKINNIEIDIEKIKNNISQLSQNFEYVLIEGAGGLMVPINGKYTIIDLIFDLKLPIILVTKPKLGTLNHTFLSLEVLKNKNINVLSVIYNNYTNQKDEIVLDNIMTMKYFYPEITFIEIEDIESVVDIIENTDKQ